MSADYLGVWPRLNAQLSGCRPNYVRRAKRRGGREGSDLDFADRGWICVFSCRGERKAAGSSATPVSTARGKCLVNLDSYARVADMLDEDVSLEKLR